MMKTMRNLFVITLVFILVLTPVACAAPMPPAGASAAMSNESTQATETSPANNEAQATPEPPTAETAPPIEFVLPNLCDPDNPTFTRLSDSEERVAERRTLSPTDDRIYFVNERVYQNVNDQQFRLTIHGGEEVVARYIEETQICFEAIRMEEFTPTDEDIVVGHDDAEKSERQFELEQAFNNSQSMTEAILFTLDSPEDNLLIEMEWLDQPHRTAGWRAYYDFTLPEAERERFNKTRSLLEEQFVYLDEQGLSARSFVEWFTQDLKLLDDQDFWLRNLSEGAPECIPGDTTVADGKERLLFRIVWCALMQVPEVASQYDPNDSSITEKFVEWLFDWKGARLISDWWLALMVTPVEIHAIHFVVDPPLDGTKYHAYQSTGLTKSGQAGLKVESESATIYVRRCFDLQNVPSKTYTPSSAPTPLAFNSPRNTRFDAGVDGAPKYRTTKYTISGSWVTGVSPYVEKLQKSNDTLCS
jgi:hypothetical protein